MKAQIKPGERALLVKRVEIMNPYFIQATLAQVIADGSLILRILPEPLPLDVPVGSSIAAKDMAVELLPEGSPIVPAADGAANA